MDPQTEGMVSTILAHPSQWREIIENTNVSFDIFFDSSTKSTIASGEGKDILEAYSYFLCSLVSVFHQHYGNLLVVQCHKILTFIVKYSQGSINNKSALVQTTAWRRLCDKPLPEPMMTLFTDAEMRHSVSVNLISLHFVSIFVERSRGNRQAYSIEECSNLKVGVIKILSILRDGSFLINLYEGFEDSFLFIGVKWSDRTNRLTEKVTTLT